MVEDPGGISLEKYIDKRRGGDRDRPLHPPLQLQRPLRKTLTSGLGLDDMSLAWPAMVQLLVFIYSGIQ